MTWQLNPPSPCQRTQSATGKIDVTPTEWKEKVIEDWGGIVDATGQHPKASGHLHKQGQYRSCTNLINHRSDTHNICDVCGPICKHCDGNCRKDPHSCNVCSRLKVVGCSRQSTAHTKFFKLQIVTNKVLSSSSSLTSPQIARIYAKPVVNRVRVRATCSGNVAGGIRVRATQPVARKKRESKSEKREGQ